LPRKGDILRETKTKKGRRKKHILGDTSTTKKKEEGGGYSGPGGFAFIGENMLETSRKDSKTKWGKWKKTGKIHDPH